MVAEVAGHQGVAEVSLVVVEASEAVAATAPGNSFHPNFQLSILIVYIYLLSPIFGAKLN